METAVQIFAIVHFTILGLSHAVRPRVWVEFFTRLREEGETGVFTIGFLSLTFGSIVVAFHNVWQGIPLLLTLVGWAQVVKAVIYFVFPGFGLRRLGLATPGHAKAFLPAGIAFLVLAGLLVAHVAGLLRGGG